MPDPYSLRLDMPADTLVICYHAVSPTWPSELAVKPEALRAQLTSLLEQGYEPVTFSEAALARGGEEKLLAATFDDAFLSVFEHGRPLLAELGVPATLFVPTNFPESGVPFPLPEAAWIGTEHESELAVMDWDQIRQLRDEGWEIGSHTCSHPWLTQIPNEQLSEELARSKAVCEEQLREPTRSIAYPYGNHDDRVVAATATAGYETACTVPHRFEPFESTPLRYARIDVTRTESERAFQVRTSARSRRARTTAAARAGHWLDTHRPRRSTVLAAVERRRFKAATKEALRERSERWGETVEGDSAAFARFGEVFVSQPYTRHFEIPAGAVVVDVGDRDGFFEAFAEEAGAGLVLRPEVGTSPDLDAILAAAGDERIGLLKLEHRGAAGAVAIAAAQTLARIDRLVFSYDPAVDPRVDEVVHRLQGAGFETWLDLDPETGAGLISARSG